MKHDDDSLSKLIEQWERDEDATMSVVAGLLALFGIVLFVAVVAWIAYH